MTYYSKSNSDNSLIKEHEKYCAKTRPVVNAEAIALSFNLLI